MKDGWITLTARLPSGEDAVVARWDQQTGEMTLERVADGKIILATRNPAAFAPGVALLGEGRMVTWLGFSVSARKAQPQRVVSRSLQEVTRLIEVYPPSWRRWCDAPERGGCACLGCVRWPAPSTVRGDPEGRPFPNPNDQLIKEEVDMYFAAKEKKE